MSKNLNFKAKLIAAVALTAATAIMTVFPALVASSSRASDDAPVQLGDVVSSAQPKFQDRVETEAGDAMRSVIIPGTLGNSTVVVRAVGSQ